MSDHVLSLAQNQTLTIELPDGRKMQALVRYVTVHNEVVETTAFGDDYRSFYVPTSMQSIELSLAVVGPTCAPVKGKELFEMVEGLRAISLGGL